MDLNHRPIRYERIALTSWAKGAFGTEDKIWTYDLARMKRLLWPTELLRHLSNYWIWISIFILEIENIYKRICNFLNSHLTKEK